jgi:hypothetical protein
MVLTDELVELGVYEAMNLHECLVVEEPVWVAAMGM